MNNEAKYLIWLLCVSLAGSLLGYLHRQAPLDAGKPAAIKAGSFFLFICTGVFVGTIGFLLVKGSRDSTEYAVAAGGFGAFYSDYAIELIKNYFNKKVG